MNQCCLLYCFRPELFQVAYLRESRRSCLVSALSLYQTLGREGTSHSILSKPWSCLRGHTSVWIEALEYIQKVACSALITSLCGKLPTFKVLIKPCRNGYGWQVYETTVVRINSLISIMHHHQIHFSECVKELLFARASAAFVYLVGLYFIGQKHNYVNRVFTSAPLEGNIIYFHFVPDALSLCCLCFGCFE